MIPRTETVTLGFGPLDQYVATFPTIQAARKALFEMHRDSQLQMMGGEHG